MEGYFVHKQKQQAILDPAEQGGTAFDFFTSTPWRRHWRV
jgi:hypothetical protein